MRARASGLRTHTPTGMRTHKATGMRSFAPAPAALTERERINKIKDPQACAEAGYVWNPGWNACIPVEN